MLVEAGTMGLLRQHHNEKPASWCCKNGSTGADINLGGQYNDGPTMMGPLLRTNAVAIGRTQAIYKGAWKA